MKNISTSTRLKAIIQDNHLNIKQFTKWLTDWWQHADDDHRGWLKIQLKNTK